MKNIIFDWSGVVKDSLSVHLWIMNKIFEKHGVGPISMEEMKENWQQPYMLFYHKYMPGISMEQQAKDYKELILGSECPKRTACAGVPELIRNLKQKGYFLAVVSSDFKETILAEIKEYGLEGVFDEVASNVYDKLAPTQELIKNYNLNPTETYFVGDSNHEIEVARKLGIKSAAVTWGFFSEERLKNLNPDFLVQSAEELGKVLE